MFKSYSNGQFAIGLIVGAAFAIFAIVWVIGLNYCPEAPCNYDYKHSHGPTDGPTQHQGWIPRPDLPNYTLQSEPVFSEGSPKEYEYADLQAQENMARATNWIVWVSLFSSVVAVAGVGLLISNLNVTREVGEAQSRAYLAVSAVNAQYVTVSSDQGTEYEWHIEFKLRNSGQTPARNIWCKADIITPHAEASGDSVVTFDISGNSDGMFEVRCDVSQGGDAFESGLVDNENFNLRCRITIGFTDVFDKRCGPFHFLFGATKNFGKNAGGRKGLLPIHETGA